MTTNAFFSKSSPNSVTGSTFTISVQEFLRLIGFLQTADFLQARQSLQLTLYLKP